MDLPFHAPSLLLRGMGGGRGREGAGMEETYFVTYLFTDSEAVARVTARLNTRNTVPLCLLWCVFHYYLLTSIGAQNSLRNWDRATKAWSFHPKEVIRNLGLARSKPAIYLISTSFTFALFRIIYPRNSSRQMIILSDSFVWRGKCTYKSNMPQTRKCY